ncbi:MAG: hypothetical protein J5663_02395, partial [Bacteroidaceae bacterium]|nr:hypothetical protein [Bacteroidaceae bacterium]
MSHNASDGNVPSLSEETAISSGNPNYQWRLISPEQFNALSPSRIKSDLSALGDGINVSWKTNLSTVKENGEWLPSCSNATNECLHLQIGNVPAGKYIVNFYGKSSGDKANVVVRCSYDDSETATNKKGLSKEYKNHLLLISVDRDNSTLDILVNAGLTEQNVSGILRNIKKISNEQYETMQTTWMYEKFSAGSYYVFNDGASKYLTAVDNPSVNNGNYGKVTSDIAAAFIFDFTGENNATISYQNGAKYYVRNNETWLTKSPSSWNIDEVTGYGNNAYTIKTGNNYIQYSSGDDISYTESTVSANNVWRFVSKEQFYAVYPTDKIKEMLKKHVSNYNIANVTATRDFSKAFSIGKVGSRYVVQQNALGFNNKYTVSGLTPGRYIVELYAAKQKGFDGIEAKVYVNGESHIVSDTLETYTFTVDVKSDGLLTVYEDELFESEAGIGNMLLAFKDIVPEKVVRDKYASIFTGETLKSNTSYYINSIGGNSYITSISGHVDSIYNAIPFTFSMDDDGDYRIANGSNKIGHHTDFWGDVSLANEDNTAWTATASKKTALGQTYFMYHRVVWSDWYWVNNGGNLSVKKSNKDDDQYRYRMISEDQYSALYPQNKIRSSVYNNNVTVTREFSANIAMSEPQSGIWLVKQTKDANEEDNYLKITINNLKDDRYVVDLYALKAGNGTATIYAHTGDKLYKWDDLTTSLKTYSNEIEVKGGTLILYVSAGENVSSVSCAINSIKTYSKVQEENSTISIKWQHETFENNGQYRLYNEQNNAFLCAPGSTGMQLDAINSTLFNVEKNGSGVTLSFDDEGALSYVCQNNGIGAWGRNNLNWTLTASGSNGYFVTSTNTDRKRYIECSNKYLSYSDLAVRGGLTGIILYYGSPSTEHLWRFVSKEQYEALSAAEMSRCLTYSIGKSVNVRWEQSIEASLNNGLWMGTTSTGGKLGKYNKITVEGLPDGWYDVQMNAGIGNSEAYLVAESETRATRTLLNGAYYTYSLPVKVSNGTLSLYIESKNNNYINVSSTLKDIVPLNKDNGVVDTYIKNSYFAIPKDNRDWNDGWEIEGDVTFEPAVGSAEDGLTGSAIHPEIKTVAWQSSRVNGAKIHQTITFDSEQGGDYILSADVCSYPNTSTLYVKVGDNVLGSVECSGEKQTYTLELNIPADSEVEIGLRVDNGNNSGKLLVAADNFRLQEYDNYLKNPGFSNGESDWTFTGMTYNSGTSSRGSKFDKYVTISGVNGNLSSGQVKQTVHDDSGNVIKVSAGAYRLSADVCVRNAIGSLFAKVGTGDDARTQKKYIGHTGTSGWPADFYYKEFVFVVPVESEVTVGLNVESATNAWDSGIDVDNFHLVRIGDVEGADITSQIVNSEFTTNPANGVNAKNDNANKKYGWESTTPGFQNYANDCAEVNYGGSGTYANEYKIKQVVSGLPNGWYRVEAQGFYRYGATASASANKAKALMYANESYASIKLITDETGVTYPTTLEAAATLFEENPTMYMNSLSVHVKDGTIELGVRRDKADNNIKDWLVLNNFKLYYLYEENVLEDVSGYIKNPSFETGSILDWTPGNLGSDPQAKAVGSASQWDKNYYYQSPNDNKVKSLSQVVSGLPAGEYKITAQIKADGG